MDLRARTRRIGTTIVVELDGDADLASVPEIRQALARAVDTVEVEEVLVDVDAVTVLDDAALGQVIGHAATARRRGIRFGIVCTNDRLRGRLRDTRIDDIIEVSDGVTSSRRRPDTPYTAVIFTNRRTGDDEAGYGAMAERMEQLASEQPGYLGIESVRAESGDGITVSYWSDADAAVAWKAVGEHLGAQQLGRERWYDRYTVRVATVDREYGFARPIFHLALPDDWASARRDGTYAVSTRGISIAAEGFMHCSFSHQMRGVADRFYADVDELVILHLDRGAIDDAIRLEPPADGIDELFPHLYGELPVDAVRTTTTWRRGSNGWGEPPVAT